MAESMTDLLQCSVCLSLPECNIYHCSKSDSHLTCQNCHSQLPKPPLCPTCREPFPATPRRSHLAEQAVANLAQSTSASQSPQPPATPSVPVGAALQVGLSEEEALELAIQESQKMANNPATSSQPLATFRNLFGFLSSPRPSAPPISQLGEQASMRHPEPSEAMERLQIVDPVAADTARCKALVRAAENGDVTAVKRLIRRPDVDVNFFGEINDWTALFSALYYDHQRVVQLLVEHPNVDVNKPTRLGHTPLYAAGQKGNADCVGLLLAHPQIKVNKATNDGVTPLYIASQEGHDDCISLLLAHPQIDVNKANNKGVTPLYIAGEEGHDDCASHLLAHPQIEVNKASDAGLTPLITASYYGHLEVVKQLLNYPKIDVNVRDNDGDTALDCARKEGHTEIVSAIRAWSRRF